MYIHTHMPYTHTIHTYCTYIHTYIRTVHTYMHTYIYIYGVFIHIIHVIRTVLVNNIYAHLDYYYLGCRIGMIELTNFLKAGIIFTFRFGEVLVLLRGWLGVWL